MVFHPTGDYLVVSTNQPVVCLCDKYWAVLRLFISISVPYQQHYINQVLSKGRKPFFLQILSIFILGIPLTANFMFPVLVIVRRLFLPSQTITAPDFGTAATYIKFSVRLYIKKE